MREGISNSAFSSEHQMRIELSSSPPEAEAEAEAGALIPSASGDLLHSAGSIYSTAAAAAARDRLRAAPTVALIGPTSGLTAQRAAP